VSWHLKFITQAETDNYLLVNIEKSAGIFNNMAGIFVFSSRLNSPTSHIPDFCEINLAEN
jgi:hypothetical protein